MAVRGMTVSPADARATARGTRSGGRTRERGLRCAAALQPDPVSQQIVTQQQYIHNM